MLSVIKPSTGPADSTLLLIAVFIALLAIVVTTRAPGRGWRGESLVVLGASFIIGTTIMVLALTSEMIRAQREGRPSFISRVITPNRGVEVVLLVGAAIVGAAIVFIMIRRRRGRASEDERMILMGTSVLVANIVIVVALSTLLAGIELDRSGSRHGTPVECERWALGVPVAAAAEARRNLDPTRPDRPESNVSFWTAQIYERGWYTAQGRRLQRPDGC